MIPSFRENRILQRLLVWLCLIWLWAAIDPFNRRDWLLENLLVLVYAVLLIGTYRRFAFSNLSYGLFVIFLSLHLVGSHYTYSEVPFGYWLQDAFNLSCNHYDRIVHFSYGLLLAYPFRETLLRLAKVRPAWVGFITVSMVLAFSAFFEVVEAIVAMVVSPELGDAYLGTQGDIWDAQKDMVLAFSGAVIAMLIVGIIPVGRWSREARDTRGD